MSDKNKTSYPKEKINILFLENISDVAVQHFKAGGYSNVKKLNGALSEEQLIKEIKNIHIDPIDGTGNFASGKSPFGMMIALLQDGDRSAGWLFDPVSGRMCHAARGRGAFIDGARVQARESGGALPVAALALHFLSEERANALKARARGHFDIVPIPRCAAEQYPRLVLGTNDISLFERSLPWDHAPGALFLEEAGGVIRRNDGSDYRVGDGKSGLLGAASPRLWDLAARVLFG